MEQTFVIVLFLIRSGFGREIVKSLYDAFFLDSCVNLKSNRFVELEYGRKSRVFCFVSLVFQRERERDRDSLRSFRSKTSHRPFNCFTWPKNAVSKRKVRRFRHAFLPRRVNPPLLNVCTFHTSIWAYYANNRRAVRRGQFARLRTSRQFFARFSFISALLLS